MDKMRDFLEGLRRQGLTWDQDVPSTLKDLSKVQEYATIVMKCTDTPVCFSENAPYSIDIGGCEFIAPESLKLVNYEKVPASTVALERFLLDGSPKDQEIPFFINGSESSFLFPISGSDPRDVSMTYTRVDFKEKNGAAIFINKFTVKNKGNPKKLNQRSKSLPLAFPPVIADTYVIPDWVEEEDRKSREKKRKEKQKSKKKQPKKKHPSKQNGKIDQQEEKDFGAGKPSSIKQDKNPSCGELEVDNFDDADWVTIGPSKSVQNKRENPPKSTPVSEREPENVAKKISFADKVKSTSNIVLRDQGPKDDVSVLQEKLERYEMCQICYERFDDDKHAKYSHQCGHGACLSCMKMEFARQRNQNKKKFYCHCGFEILEKKMIRMFI